MAKRNACERALDSYSDSLSSLRNVVGLGIVPAGEEAKGRDLAVAVYVTKKLPLAKLRKADVVPASLRVELAGKVVEVPTRVIEQGEVTLE
jgi:hypothetical protein